MNRKQLIGFALGPVLASVCSIFTLPITTWLFPAEDIGRIALLQALTSFAVLFFSVGLDQSYVREYHDAKSKFGLFKLSFTPGFLLLISFFIGLFWLKDGGMLSFWLFDFYNTEYSILIVVSIFSVFLTRFISLILRMQEKGILYSISQILPKFLLLVTLCIYLIIEIPGDFIYLLYTHTVVLLSVFLFFLWNTRYEIYGAINASVKLKELLPMARFGSPLIIGGMAYWGLTSSDKILIKELSSLEELALYSVSVSFASAAIILQKIFSIVWAPSVYKWVSNNQDLSIVTRVTSYVQLLALCVFLITGAASPLIPLLLPEQYSMVQSIVLPCMVFPLFYTLSETTVIGISILRKTMWSMLISIICLIVNLFGNFLLIPKYGASGAAVSTVFTFGLFLLLRTIISDILWRPFKRRYFYTVNAIIVCISIVHIIYSKNYSIAFSCGYLILLLTILFVKKREFIKMYRELIKGES